MKTYPNRTIEHAARNAGARVQCLWESHGPKDTDIAWITATAINGTVVIVQTFKTGGFEVYTPSPHIAIADTIKDVLTQCNVTQEAVL